MRRIEIGDSFKIDADICGDVELLEWYAELDDEALIVADVDYSVNGIWTEDCPYRIDMADIELLD